MSFFFFSAPPTTGIYTLSLHDALPICPVRGGKLRRPRGEVHDRGHRRAEQGWSGIARPRGRTALDRAASQTGRRRRRSEEHTSELQSRQYLVCRLLLEKKKKKTKKKQ